jgi:hypothetical protein
VLLSIAIMALLLTDADAKRRSSAQGSQAAGASGSWCATYSWKGINDNCSFATQQQCLAQVWGLGGFCRPNPFPGTPYGGSPMLDIRRRSFITLLGGTAAWPLAARAQQAAMPAIGTLIGGSAESFAPFEPAFRKGLNEGSFPDGSNVPFESRRANGQVDRLPALAADLVDRRPNAIATQTLPAALAAKAATSTIPVVFVIGEDPIKVGLVGSLSRPGGNVTGMTNFMNVLGAKRLELVSEAVPSAVMLGLLLNPTNPNAEADGWDLQAAAQALGRRLQVLTAGTDHELETAFACRRTESWRTSILSCSPSANKSPRWRHATRFPRSIRFGSTSRPVGW